ncbi:carotenoid oxygenase family protein [Pseudoalteromonas sp. G4]|uniref:carotenoid oxygenase family protein n=1 Tax=Pseudoalteromonas sp. G4 TaxID=2992761 RepID=UPI00237DACC9|nr:carotenoid oxygenase family protein [Pseudoalteromonas sp. G4]MDE3270827.1 carotenoid oxygenase family protein [Pseudoalteromonas sp. G4]
MQRRDAIKSLLGLSVVAGCSALPAFANLPQAQNDLLKLNAELFKKAKARNPNLIGFEGVTHNLHLQQLTIEGALPHDFRGAFYRNGPAVHQRNNQRYLHLFEGDGMIQQFSFTERGISHQGKFVQTAKYQKEQAANKFLFSGPDSKLQNSLSVNSPDAINTANTNVIPVNGELWALWEAGSATALDATSLATKGVVNLGKNTRFGNSLKGLPFSAHPKIDADGSIWNFGSTINGDIVLYHINKFGITQKVNLLQSGYRGGMLHDFLITQHHVLLILPSLERDKTDERFFGAIRFNKQQPMRVLVVDKNTLTLKREYQLDAGFVFHFGNAWEDATGTIRFDASLYPNIETLHYMSDLMRGVTSEAAPANTVLFKLHPNGTSDKQIIDGISEFPRVYDHLTGLQNNLLVTLSSVTSDVWSDSVRVVNVNNGKQDTFVYGEDFLVEEHVIFDKSQQEGNGYLVGTALHVPSKRTCVNIFKIGHVSDGPICRAWLPYTLPLGFHGNFMAV